MVLLCYVCFGNAIDFGKLTPFIYQYLAVFLYWFRGNSMIAKCQRGTSYKYGKKNAPNYNKHDTEQTRVPFTNMYQFLSQRG